MSEKTKFIIIILLIWFNSKNEKISSKGYSIMGTFRSPNSSNNWEIICKFNKCFQIWLDFSKFITAYIKK